MSKGILIKILPVLGSIILFFAWVFQQSLLGAANSTVARIDSAQSVFRTYQSNNGIFNALLETVKDDSESVDHVRRSQIYSYELGLRELEDLLDDVDKKDIPPPVGVFDGSFNAVAAMRQTQARIDVIQGKVIEMRANVTTRKATLNTLFLGLYAVGSLTVLIGSVSNAITSTKSHESQASTHKK